MWASGTAPPVYASEKDVVHELLCIDCIYQFTPYAANIQTDMRCLALYLHKCVDLKWPVAWEIVKKLGPDIIKYKSMHEARFLMPDFEEVLAAQA